ncbi:hypothetical protein SLEP1_g60313 [Rubroshorea leprosula]|uniref:Uncharacterized protein n=1 Tax=Rubroshorea leprosula TaxID=152421 RepID=A0AAV5MW66_9ROSI|nr:hypothetical protein SLEP1_g60313 [Rubroshorea leprosula]
MQGGKEHGVIVAKFSPPQQNLIEQLQVKYKELEKGFQAWLAKQTLLVETTVNSAINGAKGAAMGYFMGILTKDVSTSMPTASQANLNPQAMASFQQAQVPISVPYEQSLFYLSMNLRMFSSMLHFSCI